MTKIQTETSIEFLYGKNGGTVQPYGGTTENLGPQFPTEARVSITYKIGNIYKHTITYKLYVGQIKENSTAEVMFFDYQNNVKKKEVTLNPEDKVVNSVEEFLSLVEKIYNNGNNIELTSTENKEPTHKTPVNLTIAGKPIYVNTLTKENTTGLLTASFNVPFATVTPEYKSTALEINMIIGNHIGYALNKQDKLVFTGGGITTVKPNILIFESIDELKKFIESLEKIEISYGNKTTLETARELYIRHN